MNRNELMNKLKDTLEKFGDKVTLLEGIREIAYDGLFDYKDTCKFTRQMNWYLRNYKPIYHANFLMSKLFNTKKW